MTLDERLSFFLGQTPTIGAGSYVAESAELIGAITLAERVNILPKVVIRADINSVTIGAGSNLQDGVIVHLSDDFPVEVGENCTIGHSAILHACKIENACLIGMRATIMDGAVIGEESIVGAHTLVTRGMKIPAGSLVLGTPARVVRKLTLEERKKISYWAAKYERMAAHLKDKGI